MRGIKGFQSGAANPNWRGDNVGYEALHEWVRNHKDIPSNCEGCGLQKQLDLANISQEYLRDIKDWEWLCRKCHMSKDGRLNILTANNKDKFLNLERGINGRFIGNKNKLCL